MSFATTYFKTSNMKMKTNIIFKNNRTSKAKEAWNKILINWIKAHQKYMKQCKDDNAYFYNERASLSILAAAIWKSNGIAIEEYTSEKKYKNESFNGRVDLWFQLEKYFCLVESKQHFKKLVYKNLTTISKDLDNKMSQSIEDAKMSMHSEKNGYAIVFFTPSYKENKPIDNEAIINEVLKSNFDFIAYVIGDEKNNFEFQKDSKIIYPMGIIIGRKIIGD